MRLAQTGAGERGEYSQIRDHDSAREAELPAIGLPCKNYGVGPVWRSAAHGYGDGSLSVKRSRQESRDDPCVHKASHIHIFHMESVPDPPLRVVYGIRQDREKGFYP